jgi:ketosteroid isomerase-like protein
LAGTHAVLGHVGSRGIARKEQLRLRRFSSPFSNFKCDSLGPHKLAACGQPISKQRGGDMTGEEFAALLNEFTLSAESGDGERFASHFTEDAIYYDYIYGAHNGRTDIAHMMQDLFHRDAADYRWEMFDPVFDGNMGYAWSLSSFTSKIPQFAGKRVVIDGMSRFIVRDGLIAEYRESVNGGVAMAQLGVEPDRMTKVFRRWTGWLRERPETVEYLARPKASRARTGG